MCYSHWSHCFTCIMSFNSHNTSFKRKITSFIIKGTNAQMFKEYSEPYNTSKQWSLDMAYMKEILLKPFRNFQDNKGLRHHLSISSLPSTHQNLDSWNRSIDETLPLYSHQVYIPTKSVKFPEICFLVGEIHGLQVHYEGEVTLYL